MERPKVKRDQFEEGRAGFRPLWNIFNEKSPAIGTPRNFSSKPNATSTAENIKFSGHWVSKA